MGGEGSDRPKQTLVAQNWVIVTARCGVGTYALQVDREIRWWRRLNERLLGPDELGIQLEQHVKLDFFALRFASLVPLDGDRSLLWIDL